MQKTATASYSYPVDKIEVLKKFDDICRKEGKKMSPTIFGLIEDFVKKHDEWNNPQTIMDQYEKEAVTAIPNIYNENLDSWIKFYKSLSQEDYDFLGKRIEFLNRMHEQKKLL